MPRVDLTLTVDVERTAKVVQLEGIFDVPEAKRQAVDFHFDVPLDERPWQIGLIVGPSGAGKSSVARHMFGDAMVSGYDWHPSRSVVDSFGDLPIRDVIGALSSVGFSSPPAWLRPFRVLSNGEQFRATMARAILDSRSRVVVDEFTSVIDRTVARIGAHAIAKVVRARPEKQFVAVSCHDDITEWLQPDWTLEPHVGTFRWRGQRQRPVVSVEIVRASRDAWRWFAPHHYLSAELHRAARCFVGLVDGRPAAFAGLLHFPHAQADDIQMLSRLVVLPDFQGLGLGAYGFAEAIGGIVRAVGKRMHVVTSHPAITSAWARSTRWKMLRPPTLATKAGKNAKLAATIAVRRRTASFFYVGPAIDRATAARLWAA